MVEQAIAATRHRRIAAWTRMRHAPSSNALSTRASRSSWHRRELDHMVGAAISRCRTSAGLVRTERLAAFWRRTRRSVVSGPSRSCVRRVRPMRPRVCAARTGRHGHGQRRDGPEFESCRMTSGSRPTS
jgi:hypothetical protein